MNSDITRVLMTYLDDRALINLMSSRALPYELSTFEDEHFWHERVETLSGRRINFDPDVDWKQTYQLLKVELEKPKPSFWNKSDNVAVLKLLVSMGYSPSSDPQSLSEAAKSGSDSILAFLLAEGSIDPNDTSLKHVYPPLTLAARVGRTEAIRLLLADPRVDPNNEEGDTTALIEACQAISKKRSSEYVEIVRVLLEDGRADPTSWYGSLALVVASEFGDNDRIVRLLLEDGRADPAVIDSDPLYEAVARGREKIVALLLADGRAQPWHQEGRALIVAIEHGHANIVKLLLADGRVDPNVRGGEGLLLAIEKNHHGSANNIVKLLLADDRTHAAINDNRALIAAIATSNVEVVELLLRDPEF